MTSRSTIGPIEFIGDKNDIALVEPACPSTAGGIGVRSSFESIF